VAIVRDGVVSAPVPEMVVVPLWPEAKVFDERLVVEAFWRIVFPVAVKDASVVAPEIWRVPVAVMFVV
jgi:hypothetical protein